MPSARLRIGRGLVAGAAFGLVVGAVESALLLTTSGLGVRNATGEMLRIEAYYATACGALGSLLHLLVARRRLSGAVRWTAILTVLTVLALWLWNGLVLEKRPAAGPYAAALVVAAALAAGAGFLAGLAARLGRGAVVGALALAALIHGVVLVAVQERGAGDLGVGRWSGDPPPNVLLILVDTLRADRLGCYGYERPTSPTLDALAERGTRFDAAYASACWTRPSVASLMTSLYPSSHDIQRDLDALPPGLPTLAQLLRARGYRTAAFSANPQVSPVYGFDRGFDVFGAAGSHLLRRTAIGNLEHIVVRMLGMRVLPALLGKGQRKSAAPAAVAMPEQDPLAHSGAAALNRRVFPWIDAFDGDDPFFLYIHYIDPHTPYAAPEDLVNDGGQAPIPLPAQFIDKNAPPYPLAEYPPAPAETLAGLSRLYDAEVRFVDREIGRLLERLDGRGMLANTYVVVVSDHGEELYDHKQWLHGQSLFDELVRVPFLVAGPSVAAQAVAAPVELIDLLPTVAGWCGAEVGFPIHGRDLGPTLRGGAGDADRVVFSERVGDYAIHAVRRGARKLIRITAPEGLTWLEFDLASDPGEQTNLAAATAPDPELKARLERAVAEARALLGERSGKVEASGATAEELRALGYVEGEGEGEGEDQGGE